MAIFVIKLTSKKNNTVSYYRKMVNKTKMVDGVKMSYLEFETTDDITKAEKFSDQYVAEDYVYSKMVEYQPEWTDSFVVDIHRLPTRREMISLDMKPLCKMVSLVRNYQYATQKGKTAIRKKLFNDELVEACCESLTKISLLK